jgi:hypothetical protein
MEKIYAGTPLSSINDGGEGRGEEERIDSSFNLGVKFGLAFVNACRFGLRSRIIGTALSYFEKQDLLKFIVRILRAFASLRLNPNPYLSVSTRG